MDKKLPLISVILLALLAYAPVSHGQWVTQSFNLKSGWNAVYLHVDTTHTDLNSQVGNDPNNPIIEIWRWNPPAPTQFIDSPQEPLEGTEWTSWVRDRPSNTLHRMVGNSAYLVRVNINVATYNWQVKGIPVAPRREWTLTGLNFIGFPTVPVNPPNFETFFAPSPEFNTEDPEIYYYNGGELDVNNPLRLFPSLFRSVTVNRGQAYWIRAGAIFNRYFGPFDILLNGSGIQFGKDLNSASFRLRNLTSSSLTVNIMLTASETPPTGQPSIVTTPPLLIRGALNPNNLTYGYTNLPTGVVRSWTLTARDQPGSEIEVVLGLNRSAITESPGSFLAGVLKFTDSLGSTRVDVPVSATADSKAGLWIGGASINQVQHYLKSYERDNEGNPTISSNGNYVVSSIDTSLGDVPLGFPLRLIVHNPETGNAVLMQRVFQGLDPKTNLIVTASESALAKKFIKDARRITAVHLPWTEDNDQWPFNSRIGNQNDLTTSVVLGYKDQASNPFLHTYHPDHDNLNVTFKNMLPQGSESFSVQRDITLDVKPPADDFSSLVQSGLTVVGDYSEIITLKGLAQSGGEDTRELEVRGIFKLIRVSDIPTLTIAP